MAFDSTNQLHVIGAGPAGMGLVMALCNRVAAGDDQSTPARQLLDSMRMFEASASPGGKMGCYRINANTSSHDVVQGIHDGSPFVTVRDRYLKHPQTQDRLIPLSRVAALMVQPLAQAMVEFLGNRLQCGVDIKRVEIDASGLSSYDRNDCLRARSPQVLFCCGGSDSILPELRRYRDRWEGSATFLMRDCLHGLPADGASGKKPVVIIGASHSALSCAWRLLHDPLFSEFAAARDIVILHRRKRFKLRATTAFARAHDVQFDPLEDVCPSTGLVFFNGGLRKDAKYLYLDIRDGRESRVTLTPIESIGDAQKLLQAAGLIVQATGFTHNLPIVERSGIRLRLGNPTRCGELRDLDTGKVVTGCFGMGLGFNILPKREPRGEASFNGGIHGFQSYPLAVAPPIIDRLLAASE